MSCPFKNIFGKPREGVHSLRIFDIAVVDTVLTVLLAKIVQMIFFRRTEFWFVFLCVFIFGEFLHRIFCVDTTISKALP